MDLTKDVQVRLHNGEIEIYYGEVLVAKRPAQDTAESNNKAS